MYDPNAPWSDQDEARILAIQQALYYSDNGLDQLIQDQLRGLGGDEAADLLAAALAQIKFEQAERRRYIVNFYFSNPDFYTRREQELVVRQFAHVPVNQPLADAANAVKAAGSASLKTPNMAAETTQQATVFDRVADHLETYYTERYSRELVAPFYSALQRLGGNVQDRIYGAIGEFFDQIGGYGASIPLDQISISPAVIDALEEFHLATPLQDATTFAGQLDYLARLQRIIEGLRSQAQQHLTDPEVIRSIALYLYYMST